MACWLDDQAVLRRDIRGCEGERLFFNPLESDFSVVVPFEEAPKMGVETLPLDSFENNSSDEISHEDEEFVEFNDVKAASLRADKVTLAKRTDSSDEVSFELSENCS